MTLPLPRPVNPTEMAGNQIPPAFGRRVEPFAPWLLEPCFSLVGRSQQFLRDLNGSAGPAPHCKRKGSQECLPPLLTPIVAGIDVGKSRLDAHVLPLDQGRSFANDKCGRRAVRNWLLRLGVTRAVFEPTARYHRQLHQCLFAAGIDTVLANPLRSRRLAEALGRLAKNDRVDALMLATYGQLDNLRAVQPKPRKLRDLSDLVAMRRKLVVTVRAGRGGHGPLERLQIRSRHVVVEFAGPASAFPGVDELFVGPIPRSIRRREADVVAIVDGQMSTAVTIAFK